MPDLLIEPTGSDVAPESVVAAAEVLQAGEMVVFATETVYGLGADARNGLAVAHIFETKGRPSFNPLIVHVSTVEEAEKLVMFSPLARRLAAAFWPGPLSLVLRARAGNGISSLVSAGLETLAVRVPSHPSAQALLRTAGCPIAAPSANRSGRISPTRAEHVRDEFGEACPMMLDGGASAGGLESTIVDVSGDVPLLLRPGTLVRDDLEAAMGRPFGEHSVSNDARPNAPGQLASHYAPVASVRLDVSQVPADAGLLGFGSDLPETNGPTRNLSEAGDLREAAASLFDSLRYLDATGVREIVVMPIPNVGIGVAINDRLRRAAAPRT